MPEQLRNLAPGLSLPGVLKKVGNGASHDAPLLSVSLQTQEAALQRGCVITHRRAVS